MLHRTRHLGSSLRPSALRLVVPSAIALLAPACGDDSGSSTGTGTGGGETAATYYAHAKPILDAKCGGCHVEGGIAPFALTSYADVAEHAASIKSSTEARRMPPWPPSSECADYTDDRSLSDEQIALLGRWVDGGAAEGSPSEEAPPLERVNSRALSRVDRELGMLEPYTMRLEPDDYRCFVLDWPEADVTYVTGFGTLPGNAAVVHHVIAYLATPSQVADATALDDAEEGPGYTCYGGPGFNSDWLGAWAPGSEGSDFPEGTGLRVEPGSKIVLQLHYNSLTAGALEDQTRLLLKLDDTVEKEAKLQPWTNPQWVTGDSMAIPAATRGTTHSWGQDPTRFFSGNKPITIYSPSLHMHQLGRSARLSIQRDTGDETCLLDIPDWNFHWQGNYGLVDPVVLNPGDQLFLSCTWDNDTMSLVTWGEGTNDEMCLGTFYYTVND
jgi:hypothetical protein